MSLSFFQFMANLEQSGSRILDAWSVILTFSLIAIFHRTEVEDRIKKIYNTALILLIWVKVPFLSRNGDFLQKKYDISKGYIFWNYIWVCTYVPNFKISS